MKPKQAWLSYFLHLTPNPRSDLNQADCIVAAAFGRNSIPDPDLEKIAQLHKESHGFDYLSVVKVCENNFDAGKTNHAIADTAKQLFESMRKLLIIQWEIACAFDPIWLQKNINNIYIIWPQVQSSKLAAFSSFDFVKIAAKRMSENNLSNPLLIAHKDHMIRVYMIFKKLKFTPHISTNKIKTFDPLSVQVFTRNKFLWQMREIIARIHHWFAEYV